MKFPSINKVSPLELVLFVVFILYLIFPIPTPAILVPYVNTNISLGAIVILTLYMFLYTTPILGVLSIFVAYELLRRSSNGLVRTKVPMVRHTPSQPKKDQDMKNLNPPKETTLEETIIQQMAPIGKNSVVEKYVETSFKPVHDKISGASMV
jgi:hypothetical protein|uniref:Uncharacterized protein n=1 Tax=viral metagenome TaxID=1070528 RepID=A0A6C0CPS1_9ZZZZ